MAAVTICSDLGSPQNKVLSMDGLPPSIPDGPHARCADKVQLFPFSDVKTEVQSSQVTFPTSQSLK